MELHVEKLHSDAMSVLNWYGKSKFVNESNKISSQYWAEVQAEGSIPNYRNSNQEESAVWQDEKQRSGTVSVVLSDQSAEPQISGIDTVSVASSNQSAEPQIGGIQEDPVSTVYDVALKKSPHSVFWQWCEGACRLRGNASLTPRDISKDWVDGSFQVSCNYCNQECFGVDWNVSSKADDPIIKARMKKALKFFAECHITVHNGPAYVCHVCYSSNRNDAEAGPHDWADMWNHWTVHHEPLKKDGEAEAVTSGYRRKSRASYKSFMRQAYIHTGWMDDPIEAAGGLPPSKQDYRHSKQVPDE